MSSLTRTRMARWLSGEGIELGALHQPTPLQPGTRVSYVDRLGVPDLRAQYPELASSELVPVDVIGSAEELLEFGDSSLDFVIANHVLEHIEDPTKGLLEIHRVLREGGLFLCALPEPRVTFDRHRGLTTVEHLLADHSAGRAPRREHFADWVDNVERHEPWWQEQPPEREARISRLMEIDYSIHYHVWRPDTFIDYVRAICHQLNTEFEIVAFASIDSETDNEFIFLLRKGVAEVPVRPPVETADSQSGYPLPSSPSGQSDCIDRDWLVELAIETTRCWRRAREEAQLGGTLAVARATGRWVRRRAHRRR